MRINKKVSDIIQFALSVGYAIEIVDNSVSVHNEIRSMVIDESGVLKCDGVARIIKSNWEVKEFLIASAK